AGARRGARRRVAPVGRAGRRRRIRRRPARGGDGEERVAVHLRALRTAAPALRRSRWRKGARPHDRLSDAQRRCEWRDWFPKTSPRPPAPPGGTWIASLSREPRSRRTIHAAIASSAAASAGRSAVTNSPPPARAAPPPAGGGRGPAPRPAPAR